MKVRMKTIGLIGGTSFESTITYYDQINCRVNRLLGGSHSAKCILYSVDFEEIESRIHQGNWEMIADILTEAAVTLENAGVDVIILCTNTLHRVIPSVEERIHVPVLHIAEATADRIVEQGIKKVGLLGTAATMTLAFYKERLNKRGIEVVIPSEADIEIVDKVIFDELCHGQIKSESKREYLRIIDELQKQGAKGVILGCTEIDLLIQQGDVSIPVFDTTEIHVDEVVDWALKDEESTIH